MPAASPPRTRLITVDGAATVDAKVSNAVKVAADGPATIRLTGRPRLHLASHRLGRRQRLPLDLS